LIVQPPRPNLKGRPSPPIPVPMSLARRVPLAAALGLLLACCSTGVAGGSKAGWWHPPPRPSWYWQLQGRLRTGVPALIYIVDGFETSASTVAALQRAGHKVFCYIDVGTWERWRPDAGSFPRLLLGRPVAGWPGERWLDIADLSALAPLIRRRLEMCAKKGFNGVEPDNIEVVGNDSGFSITPAEQLRYAIFIASEAHRLGLAVLQKNDPAQAKALAPHFDGAVSEQCYRFHECALWLPYLRAGKPVLEAEYDPALYPAFCRRAAALGMMAALYNRALNGRLYRPCFALPTRPRSRSR